MRRGLVGLGLMTVTISGLIALRATAAAQPLDLRSAAVGVQQVTVGKDSSLLPLVASRLAPGTAVTARFEVHRGVGTTAGAFASQVDHVEDFENGCGHSEAADGDATCGTGAGQGELSTQLIVEQRWSAPSPDCSGSVAASVSPSLAVAAGSPVTADAPTSAGDTACLTLTVDLPSEADNLVQSDSTRFALRIGLLDAAHDGDLTGGGGTVHLGGGTVHLGGDTVPPGGRLPQTGREVLSLLALAVLAIVTGSAAVLAGRSLRLTGGVRRQAP